MKQRLGISVGTHNCYVATRLSPDSQVTLVNDAQFPKEYSTPLVVAVQNGKSVVGTDVNHLINSKNYNHVIYSSDFVHNLGNFDINPVFDEGAAWYPITLMASVFKKLIHDAKSFTNEMDIDENVICVPDEFNEFQKGDIITAAKLANLNVSKVVSRSEAVTAYFEKKNGPLHGTTLMIDLSKQVSHINVIQNSPQHQSYSNDFLTMEVAGANFDDALKRIIVDETVDLRIEEIVASSDFAYRQLNQFVERLKIQYCLNPTSESIKDLLELSGQFIRLVLNSKEISNAFREVAVSATVNLKVTLENKGMDISSVDRVIITGGTSQIPELKKELLSLFDKTPIHFLDSKTTKAAASGCVYLSEDLKESSSSSFIAQKSMKNIGVGVLTESGEIKIETIFKSGVVLPAEETKLFKTNRKNQSRLFLEIREFDTGMIDSTIIATLSVDMKVQLKKNHPVAVEFVYDASGKIKAFAYDQLTRKRYSCELAMSEDTGIINMLQQQVLLRETVLLNNISKPTVSRF